MHEQQSISVLRKQLQRLKEEHERRLLDISVSTHQQFDPSRRATLSLSLNAYSREASGELTTYGERVTSLVTARVKELLLPLSDEVKKQVIALADASFDETLYSRRFEIQYQSLLRKADGMGLRAQEWGVRSDLIEALHDVDSVNRIRRIVAALSDELDVIQLQSSRAAQAVRTQPGVDSMPFEDMMMDTIEIVKTDGTRIPGRKASVQRSKIFMNADGVLVEPNDLVVRRMSNGGEETFKVLDPCFYEAQMGFEAHYQMQVQKLGVPEAKAAVQSIIFNVSGNNARVNHHSVDNSTNVVQVDNRVLQLVDQLRQAVEGADLPDTDKREALEVIDEVEGAVRDGKPKKSVVSALLRSLPHVASVTEIVAAIIGLL